MKGVEGSSGEKAELYKSRAVRHRMVTRHSHRAGYSEVAKSKPSGSHKEKSFLTMYGDVC